VVVWYIFPFGYIVPRKIWQPCSVAPLVPAARRTWTRSRMKNLNEIFSSCTRAPLNLLTSGKGVLGHGDLELILQKLQIFVITNICNYKYLWLQIFATYTVCIYVTTYLAIFSVRVRFLQTFWANFGRRKLNFACKYLKKIWWDSFFTNL
jgi:hypothetical protein